MKPPCFNLVIYTSALKETKKQKKKTCGKLWKRGSVEGGRGEKTTNETQTCNTLISQTN